MNFNKILVYNLLFGLLFLSNIYSQANIFGKIRDSLTLEPLAYVNISILTTDQGAVSNSDGNFMFNNIPAGSFMLSFQRIGYKLKTVAIHLKKNETLNLNITLQELPLKLETIDVEENYWISPLAELFQGSHQLNSLQIVEQPGAFEDPLKALQSVTGVISNSDYTSNLYIRGSQPEEQAVILDGLLLQNPYRAKLLGYGGISVVNPDVISQLNLSLGGFPASYGNRLGGIIDIKTKDGQDHWQQKISVNLLAARYFLNAPLNQKMTVIFSLRRTYYDYLLKKITSTPTTYPFFSDAFVKFSWKIKPTVVFKLISLIGQEGSNLINNHRVNGDLFTKGKSFVVLASLSGFLTEKFNYKFILAKQRNSDSLKSGSSIIGEYSHYFTQTEKSSGLVNFEYEPFSWLYLATGGEVFEVKESASHHLKHLINSNPTLRARLRYRAYNFFVNSHLKIWQKLRTKIGGRVDYSTINRQMTFDPRVSLQLQINKQLTSGLAWGIYHQFPQMINLNSKHEPITPPAQLATLKTPTLNYLGFELSYRFYSGLSLRLEGYYKTTRFLRGEYVSKVENSQTTIQVTDKWESFAKGLEFNISYLSSKWQSHLGYVWSIAKFRKNKNQNWQYLYFDNRHWLNWALSFDLNKNFKMSSITKYMSGFVTNEPVGWSKTDFNNLTLIPVNNSKRHPYFRWDLRLSYLSKKWLTYLEIINVTNRKNFDRAIYYVSRSPEGDVTLNRDFIYMLPRMPVFGVSVQF